MSRSRSPQCFRTDARKPPAPSIPTLVFGKMVADVALFVFLAIKDADVAGAVQAAERDDSLSPSESRSRIFRAIQEKYTAPE